MKRILIAVTALVAFVAIALVPQATAKTVVKKFPSSITLAVAVTEPTTYTPGSGVFSGQVSSGGPSFCKAGRSVTILGPTSASGVTNSIGAYSIPVGSRPPPGNYSASTPQVVRKKVNKKTGVKKKKKCLASTVTVHVS